ncbi:MAG: hypothetical protein ACWGN7_05915, partial [Thermodesulfovibrionales bacterium]
HVETFMVDVKVSEASSERILSLIHLDLPLPPGVVTGSLLTEGRSFSPSGSFVAHFKPGTGNVMSRVLSAKGSYFTGRGGYALQDVVVATDASRVAFSGHIDDVTGAMSLTGTLNTGDLADVLAPYVEGVSGYGYGGFEVSGVGDSLRASANVHLENAGYRGYGVQRIDGRFGYDRGVVEVRRLTFSSDGEKHDVSGTVRLGKAGEKYDAMKSVLDMGIEVKNADIGAMQRVLRVQYPVSGLASADLRVRGTLDDPWCEGSVRISPLSVYGHEIDFAESRVLFKERRFAFSGIFAQKGDSLVSADLSIDLDGAYDFKTRRVAIQSRELFSRPWLPKGGVVEIDAEGRGTMAEPSISARIKFTDFAVQDEPVGDGEITVALRGRQVTASGALFSGLASVSASGLLQDNYPWRLEVAFGRGMYDFLLPYVMVEIPEDAMLDMEGTIQLWGDLRQ